MNNKVKKLISIVIPAYNEEENIDELSNRLNAIFEQCIGYEFEVIVVENGSTDTTYQKLLKINSKYKKYKIISLSRNFRMDGALTAGMRYANGDAVVLMAADLQDPPELIPQFIKKWEEGYENVYGVVNKRLKVNLIRRLNSQLFYFVANKLTNNAFPKNVSDFRLVDKKVYKTINSIEERNRFVRGLFGWVGFRSTGIEFERAPRFAGKSNADTFKVIELALKGIFSHSYLPLKLIFYFGLVVTFISIISIFIIGIKFLLYGVPFPGYGTIIILIFLLFGVLSLMIGIISEYVGLIYEEVKQRPNYIVSEFIE